MVPESILKIGITRKEWGNMDIHATLHWDRIIQLQIIYWHTHSTCLCCKTSHRQSRQPTAWGSVCTFLKGAYRMMHFYWVLFFGCTWVDHFCYIPLYPSFTFFSKGLHPKIGDKKSRIHHLKMNTKVTYHTQKKASLGDSKQYIPSAPPSAIPKFDESERSVP